jgi:thioredoxin reductase (NADPH)
MIEPEDVRAIALFAGLGDAEVLRLSARSADLRLNPGEYVVHEGDERALFVVLEGRLETTKVVDGIERVIGGRDCGELAGEVPMVLGTPFPASFRAVTEARVMRIEAREFHAIAAVAPELSAGVGALARERISGCKRSPRRNPSRRPPSSASATIERVATFGRSSIATACRSSG